ncbi:hypothetical protein O3P69_015964 [Scylla paramamosain]|uniref:Uncharacterized protein n=1 Tax=Scylla paramamosain TaxID=85552 RepID=A0AAW0T929_SCYPA
MAPVASSGKKGGKKGLLSLVENVVHKTLNPKHKSGVSKRRSHGEEENRPGCRKMIKRCVKKSVRVAVCAYGMVRETGMLGGIPGVVADAFVSTTRALLGVRSPQHMSTPIAAGWNLECEASRECKVRCDVLSVSKSPEFSTRLEFRSPIDVFIRPGEVEVRGSAGRSHTQGRLAIQGGVSSFVSPGPSATDLTVSTPQFGAHGSLIEPKTEPTSPGFVTCPLPPLQTEPILFPRIKTERTRLQTEAADLLPRIKEERRIKREVL